MGKNIHCIHIVTQVREPRRLQNARPAARLSLTAQDRGVMDVDMCAESQSVQEGLSRELGKQGQMKENLRTSATESGG